ncbi:MAG: DUF3298 domain-containing protein [Bacteroidales bacterium]|nr:DUF3298 domain-containing protein [Bacteroidales bacterium]
MNKSLVFSLMFGAAVLTGCAGGGNNGETKTADNAEPLKFQQFKDSVSFQENGITHYAIAQIDFPVAGPEALVNVLKGIIAERFELPIDDAKDGQTFANKVVTSKLQRVQKTVKDDLADEVPVEMEYYIESNVTKVFENDKVVSLGSSGYDFLGGVHGQGYGSGVTIRKSDGKNLSQDMLKAGAWDQLQDKVAASLCKFLEVENNEELYEILFKENVKYDEATKTLTIPAPQNQPFIVDNNVVFAYGAYEIAPYAVGMPEVILPIKDIEDQLNPEVVELFK